MKRIAALLLFTWLYGTAMAQVVTKDRGDSDCAAMSFNRDTLNVGILKHNITGIKIMRFKNNGKCPLIISSVSGMPRAQYFVMKTFLQPGDTTSVRIFYPATEAGPFCKYLTFYTNSGIKQLCIKGAVLPEEMCAALSFTADTIDLGPLPYLFGKHFAVKVLSTGQCPLKYTVAMPTDYMTVTHFESSPVPPDKYGTVEIHIGGEVTGNYYGFLNLSSVNSAPEHRSLFIKAEFLPPADDTADTEIKADKDIVNKGHIFQDSTPAHLTVQYKITNTGKKPLLLKSTHEIAGDIIAPDKPILSGKTCTVTATFNADNVLGPFVWHLTLNGNFKGKAMPLYLTGNISR